MIVDRSILNGLSPVAEGYKIFNNDWTANYGNNYCYADENGNVEGVVHKQKGFPKKCSNGLHFCENPLDCFNFYPFVQWNKFAKVRGYGAIAKDDENTKVAVEILEIVKVLSWDEFLEEIKRYTKEFLINENGYGIMDGFGIENSYGINECKYIKDCKGLSNSIMCIGMSGIYKLFNKDITEEHYNSILENITMYAYDWYPKFTNAFDLKEKTAISGKAHQHQKLRV